MELRQVTDTFVVSPQIAPNDIGTLAASGFTLVINNRPDGEAPDQPGGGEVEQAARAAGLRYVAIPITHAGFTAEQIAQMRGALDSADGRTLAYCRTGTRSILMWALAEAQGGEAPEAIAQKVAAAGYSVTPIRHTLEQLALGE